METIKIALIAHDNKKADLVMFVMNHLDFFNKEEVKLIATGTTGSKMLEAGIKKIECVKSGPIGGDAEIATQVVNGEIKAVLFFRDPLGKHPHDVDISMLMRLCDVHSIALATNVSSANYVIDSIKNELNNK